MKQRTKATNETCQDTVHCPRRRLLSVLVAQALSVPLGAQAASIAVTSTADDGTGCTLREAVATVNAGADQDNGCSISGSLGTDDQVTLDPSVSGGTITLTNGQIPITKSVAVNPGGAETTIDGNGDSRVFYVNTPDLSINLNALSLTGGDATGPAFSPVPGGAIFIDDASTLTLTHSTVFGTSISEDGGGIFAANSASVALMDSTMSGNSVTESGGAISAENAASVTLVNSTVSDNVADVGGGGVYADESATVALTNSTVSGNIGGLTAGGVVARAFASVTLTDSMVTGNSGSDDGGIGAVSAGTVELTNSTVSGNTADFGGGLGASDGTVVLTNSTVSGNTASADGGGIYASNSASVTLTNTTVSGNQAATGGGVYLNDSGGSPTLELINSIIADSTGGVDCDKDGGTVVPTVIDSIIEADACGTSAVSSDPGLEALAANGGPTETHALKPGSPAIDAGSAADCPVTDQRGVARDDGACDIGAYEFAETVLPIAFQDRAMGAVMNGADQWYRFNSMTTQRISTQTNGFGGDTRLELYTGGDPKQPANLLADDDDSGPEDFSNIRNDVDPGSHLIRVIGNPEADPFFLRLMSAEDILAFGDTQGHFAETAIGVMSAAGITGGCGSGMYCPDEPVTRAQMALFMLRAIQGGNQGSPPATGNVFGDVGPNSFAANAIEEFSTLGITAGCGNNNYCPDDPVTREQMAVFLLRALFGAGHTPPQATQAEISQFSDISDSFARDWIVQLVDEGITGGCGGNQFCPTDPVTRGQMAAFIQRTFDLDTDLQM